MLTAALLPQIQMKPVSFQYLFSFEADADRELRLFSSLSSNSYRKSSFLDTRCCRTIEPCLEKKLLERWKRLLFTFFWRVTSHVTITGDYLDGRVSRAAISVTMWTVTRLSAHAWKKIAPILYMSLILKIICQLLFCFGFDQNITPDKGRFKPKLEGTQRAHSSSKA